MVDAGRSFTILANTAATVTFENTGQFPHTFVVTDHNNPNLPNLGIDVAVDPGETETTTVNAPAGDYYYCCRIPGHKEAGMVGTLTVR
jgi:uncharacterized cupredoxin-like copper-binding protein